MIINMKKNLFTAALACISSVAFAATTTVTELGVNEITIEASDITTTQGGTATAYTGGSSTYLNSLTLPSGTNYNVGNGAIWTWKTTFTLASDMYLDTVQVALFNYSNQAKTQNAALDGAYTLTITQDGSGIHSGQKTSFTYSNHAVNNASVDNVEAAVEYTSPTQASVTTGSGYVVCESIEEVLEAGTYTLTLSVDNGGETRGHFVGLHSARLNTAAVPEPATATLSLLALAGLAARRRRK